MSDPIADAAVEVLAQRIAEDAVDHYAEEAWEIYPEVGEYDWTRAVARAKEIAGAATSRAFSAAYAVLEDRAEGEA